MLPLTILAQEQSNPINLNSETLMATFNQEYISLINAKRAETGLPALVVSDSLTTKAMQLVKIVTGIAEGEMPEYSVDHYFTCQLRQGKEITAADIIKLHWVTSGDGHFPGIKSHYTKIGIASILRKEDLLNYVIFE